MSEPAQSAAATGDLPVPIPFGDQAALEAHCLPFVRGQRLPETALELMASRYVAYSLREVDYIVATHDPATRGETDREATLDWATRSRFHGLEIVSASLGGPSDDRGEIEFIARFTADGREQVHHERSTFERKDGRWFFVDGKEIKEPVRRAEPKQGRNDPCACGSGKKYKKCHGARSG